MDPCHQVSEGSNVCVGVGEREGLGQWPAPAGVSAGDRNGCDTVQGGDRHVWVAWCVCCCPCLLVAACVYAPTLLLSTPSSATPGLLSTCRLCAPVCVAVPRTLRRLTLQDAAEASHTLTLLMGDQVAPRRKMIEEYGSQVNLAQLDI